MNLHKKTMSQLANGMGAAEKRLGVLRLANGTLEPPDKDNAGAGKRHGSCREAFAGFCGLANGRLEPP